MQSSLREDDTNYSRALSNLPNHRPSVLLPNLTSDALDLCSHLAFLLELKFQDRQVSALFHLLSEPCIYNDRSQQRLPGSSSSRLPCFPSLRTPQYQEASVVSQTSGKVIVEGLDRCLQPRSLRYTFAPQITVTRILFSRQVWMLLSPLLALAVYNWTGYLQRHSASARSPKSSHPPALTITPCIIEAWTVLVSTSRSRSK